MHKGEAYKLKSSYTHADGVVYEIGWIHEVNGSSVLLLLEPGIKDEELGRQINVVQGRPIRQNNLIVEFEPEQIGERLPFEFGGIYAG